MNLKININTKPRKFFRQYLEILKPTLKISSREADVFAELLYQNHIRQNIPVDDRSVLIFDYENRVRMEKYTKIPTGTFRNVLTSLRKKGLILGNKINEKYIIYPDKEFKIEFNFNITEDER